MSRFRLRNYTPHGLYVRLIMLVAVPVIALFSIFTIYYYQNHIRDVNEKLSQSIAREASFLIDTCNDPAHDSDKRIAWAMQLGFRLDCRHQQAMVWPRGARTQFRYDHVLRHQLATVRPYDTRVRLINEGATLDFRSQTDNGVVRLLIDRKRALAANTHFIIVWVLLGALCLLALAFAFLRNQVRSILRLTQAAQAFGYGRDMPDFRPSGATEIREAAKAVIDMRAKLTAFAEQRTAMLAAVSHDLRTPLARLKLRMAMQEETPDTAEITADLDDMGKMLDEYLAFASGEERKPTENVRLDRVIHTVARRMKGVHVHDLPQVSVTLHATALERTLSNLMSNAVAYGTLCQVSMICRKRMVDIVIDDDGPGIPQEKRKLAFEPFQRLDEARMPNIPGTGLGLTLARDFAKAHGGDIWLEDSPIGGLRVCLRLPC